MEIIVIGVSGLVVAAAGLALWEWRKDRKLRVDAPARDSSDAAQFAQAERHHVHGVFDPSRPGR